VPIDGVGGNGGGAPASRNVNLTTIASVSPATDDADMELDRCRNVRVFVSAFLAGPELNDFNGCHMLDVQILPRALIAGMASEVWLQYVDCIHGVLSVWQFFLLLRDHMDASQSLRRAVGELLSFSGRTDARALVR